MSEPLRNGRDLSPLFSAATGKWSTPIDVYDALHREFGFTLDPCPMDDAERIMESDGLARLWDGERVFCNPPYGPGISRWLAKAREAAVAVFLLPARTDTAWWHDYALAADEIRFVRGRLKFGGAKSGAPFPSVVLVYRAKTGWLRSSLEEAAADAERLPAWARELDAAIDGGGSAALSPERGEP